MIDGKSKLTYGSNQQRKEAGRGMKRREDEEQEPREVKQRKGEELKGKREREGASEEPKKAQ